MAKPVYHRLHKKLLDVKKMLLSALFRSKTKLAPLASHMTFASGTDHELVRLADETSPIVFGMPVVVCGAVVRGKPNFNLLGNFGIVSLGPPKTVVYISSRSNRFTNIGISEHQEFSVNFPDAGILAKADYCGVHSGYKVDKSGVFGLQYGSLQFAPLIKECSVCFACRVTFQTRVNDMDVFFGEIIEKYVNNINMTDEGTLDTDKMKSITFGPGSAYRLVGENIGTPWSEYKNVSAYNI